MKTLNNTCATNAPRDLLHLTAASFQLTFCTVCHCCSAKLKVIVRRLHPNVVKSQWTETPRSGGAVTRVSFLHMTRARAGSKSPRSKKSSACTYERLYMLASVCTVSRVGRLCRQKVHLVLQIEFLSSLYPSSIPLSPSSPVISNITLGLLKDQTTTAFIILPLMHVNNLKRGTLMENTTFLIFIYIKKKTPSNGSTLSSYFIPLYKHVAYSVSGQIIELCPYVTPIWCVVL